MNKESDKSDEEDLSDVPISWILEELMLEEYFLLVRRISGISLSVNEYWELDTFTTAKLLDMERKIIEEEQKEFRKQNNEYVERPDGNSEEMNNLMDEMTND